jgi:F-type H+-transporting ATPase subunit gamma
MRGSTASLRRKIGSAGDLQAVVRTMKAMAASSIGQYEEAERALGNYAQCVELGLSICMRNGCPLMALPEGGARHVPGAVDAVVFGSDQGLVGRFNDVVADFAVGALAKLPGTPRVWAVGERVHTRLTDAGVTLLGLFAVPGSVQAISPLIGQILVEAESRQAAGENPEIHLFYNRPAFGASYAPVAQRLLPLDERWQRALAQRPRPSAALPEVVGDGATALRALIREYLFVSLFRACAESLASENASRLAAMQRADKNIDDLLDTLKATFHRLRQSAIDQELFDVTAGYEALSGQQNSS